MRKLILMMMLMFAAVDSYADTGNELSTKMIEYEKYEGGQDFNATASGYYSGYVTGLANGYNGIYFCPPTNVTNGQIYKIVAKYLKNNPDKLHLLADILVVNALRDVFPCKKK